jgi:hypothetical protein
MIGAWLTRATLSLALAASAGAGAAGPPNRPPPPTGELLLDMADPVITQKIGDVPLRLRVGLEQKRLIELNPEAVDKLRADPPDKHFQFEDDADAYVGRTMLKSIAAVALVRIHERNMLVTLSSHGRDCCEGVDGEIGIDLLPYATIRFVRRGASEAGRNLDFVIGDDSEHGPQAAWPLGAQSLYLQFSLTRPDSIATASAGAILAHRFGGRLGGDGKSTGAFGIERPTTMLTLERPADLAGFRFDHIPVRTADFAGHFSFPEDPNEPGEILVSKRTTQQEAWPVVQIGRDRLDRCSEAVYDMITRRLTLRCRFDGTS